MNITRIFINLKPQKSKWIRSFKLLPNMKAITNFLVIFFGLFTMNFIIALLFGILIHLIYPHFNINDALSTALGSGLGSAILIVLIYYVILRK
jgi:hypothetical protein